MTFSLVRFALALVATVFVASGGVLAQVAGRVPQRSFTGWQTGTTTQERSTVQARSTAQARTSLQAAVDSSPAGPGPAAEPEVKTAYYQSQGSFSDLPVFPAANLSDASLPDHSAGFDLPSFPGSAGPMPSQNPTHQPDLGSSHATPGQVQPPAYPPRSDMPPIQTNPMENPLGRPNSPAPVPSRGNSVALDNSLRAEPAQYTAPNTQAVLPPGSNQFNDPRVGNVGNASGLRSTPAQPTAFPNTPRQAAGNELRPIDNRSAANTHAPRMEPGAVTTGLPFVTPPPRSRYATSPYNTAYFQMAAYQRAQASEPASGPSTQLVSAQTQVVPPGQDTRQFLPQYASAQPGIYPTAYQCTTPSPSFPATGAVPGAYVPPTFTPNLAPGVYSANNSGYAPLFSLGQENYNVQLGRGIVGQPTVYVPGQPVRNFLRYLSP